MKKDFLLKFLFLLPIPLIVITINFKFDPAHLFDNARYEQGIASLLLQGKNLANVTNLDVKLLGKYYIEGLGARKDVVIVGSSRSLSVKQGLFTNKTFFNNSITGASIEDYDYVYQLYLKQNLLPKEIIIGLDPWILNKNKYSESEIKQNSLISIVRTFINSRMKLNSEELSKYYQLVSPSYFQSSFSLFFASLKNGKIDRNYQVINDAEDPRIAKYADGSTNLKMIYGDDPQKAGARALVYDPAPLLGDFAVLDPIAMLKLESLVDQMQKDGCRVVFYLPPYHPVTYRYLVASEKYKIISEVQSYFKVLAKNKGITVYGSYNPEDYQLGVSDFYDGTHPTETATIKIFNWTKIAD